MNFKTQHEYNLYKDLQKEAISLYGLKVQHKDEEFYVLPENQDEFSEADFEFSEYGFLGNNTFRVFVPFEVAKSKDIKIKDLLKFPDDKLYEITHIDIKTQGINNLFLTKLQKSVWCLTLVSYSPENVRTKKQKKDKEIQDNTKVLDVKEKSVWGNYD